jgi:hypothetical protein
LSVVELQAVRGLTLHVKNIDLIDGTPVLDIKPYVPFADAIASAKTGWLDARDPAPAFTVAWSPLASEQVRWLADTHDVDLAERVTRTLSIGPEPHPYRRIKRQGAGYRLALKDWRVDFRVDGRAVTVEGIASGYRQSELATSTAPSIAVHRAFMNRFGDGRC